MNDFQLNLFPRLSLLDQFGVIVFLQRPIFIGKNPCSMAGLNVVRKMQTGDFLGLFYVYVTGISLATVVFMVEKMMMPVLGCSQPIRVAPSAVAPSAAVRPKMVRIKAKKSIEELIDDEIEQILRNAAEVQDLH